MVFKCSSNIFGRVSPSRRALLLLQVLAYLFLETLKRALKPEMRKSHEFFGFDFLPVYTAALLKAAKLREIFGNRFWHNSIVYVCSGNIPLWYCDREKKRGVKVVVNQNGVYYPGWYGAGYALANKRDLLGHYKLADYIIYQSRFCEESAKKYLGPPDCRHEVLYNPVDTKKFFPAGRIYSPESPVFLATGNFDGDVKRRRLQLLLDAFAIVHKGIPGSRLIIAGTISHPFLSMAPESQGAVSFLGSYNYKNAPGIYQQADIYLNSQFNDACPSAVLEAMSSGLPVVYLNCGGTPELVGDAGVAVDVVKSWEKSDYPPAAKYSQAIFSAVKLQENLSVIARRRCAELFDVVLWNKRHAEIFKEVLS